MENDKSARVLNVRPLRSLCRHLTAANAPNHSLSILMKPKNIIKPHIHLYFSFVGKKFGKFKKQTKFSKNTNFQKLKFEKKTSKLKFSKNKNFRIKIFKQKIFKN